MCPGFLSLSSACRGQRVVSTTHTAHVSGAQHYCLYTCKHQRQRTASASRSNGVTTMTRPGLLTPDAHLRVIRQHRRWVELAHRVVWQERLNGTRAPGAFLRLPGCVLSLCETWQAQCAAVHHFTCGITLARRVRSVYKCSDHGFQ
jgi:hypothetical protein